MTSTRALIVDDSRTAQHRLKRLLTRYKLEVDTAISAEEALGYLSYKIPSVIFMDHHMEGMDGLAALKILKANPSTATIPVIMYTSQDNSDDVYAGQAHALGALDTLSKDLMKPARVEEVLAKLNILPGEEIQQPTPTKDDSTSIKPSPTTPRENDSRIGANAFKAQIARLFELHIADVRTQISENTKFVVRRLAAEIKHSAKKSAQGEEQSTIALNDEEREKEGKNNRTITGILGLILFALAIIAFQLFQNQQQSAKLKDDVNQLANLNHQSNLLLDDIVITAKAAEEALNKLDSRVLLNTISWAMSIDMHFPYGEEPLNEKRIINLQNLTFRLADAQFNGFIELNIQLGDYCLTQVDGGEWEIPPADTPIDKCTFMKDRKLDLSAESYTSVSYMQFEQSAAPIVNGTIEYLINLSAFENSRYPYPDLRPSLTAGEWNAIAKQNQQIILIMDGAN